MLRSRNPRKAATRTHPVRERGAKHDKPVVVVGLGRFGAALCHELVDLGYHVVAVDRDPRRVAALADVVDLCVEADATDSKVLADLGVARAKLVVVATASDVESSTLSVAALSDAGVEEIWAKATSSRHAEILRRVGAHRTIEPESEMGKRTAKQVGGRVLDYLQLDEDFALVEVVAPRALHCKSLGESQLRTRHQVTVVAVKHGGKFTHTDADTMIAEGDLLVVAGHPDDVARVAQLR